jgi:polyhydroxyalkanoate synthase
MRYKFATLISLDRLNQRKWMTEKSASANNLLAKSRAAVKNSIGRRFNREHYFLQNKSVREQIFQEGLLSVSYYLPLQEERVQVEGETVAVNPQQYATPLVMVPPLGVYGWVFDLMAERSLVRYFLAQGFQVYLIDWGTPTQKENHLSLETYTLDWFPKVVDVIRQHSGQPEVTLLGYCMGGLLSLIYTAAKADHHVKNLVTIASPVNFHQMSSAIGKTTQLLSGPAGLLKKLTGYQLDDFDSSLFHVNGKLLSIGFKLTQPMATFSSYVDLVKNLSNKDYVSRYTTMNEWFNNMPDYPGATMREMIEKFGLANRMNRGRFYIGGREVSFKTIKSALLAIAGDNDAITSIAAASAVLTVVGSMDKTFEVVPGGHAGLFTGSRAVKTTWVITSDWLKLRSGELVDRP